MKKKVIYATILIVTCLGILYNLNRYSTNKELIVQYYYYKSECKKTYNANTVRTCAIRDYIVTTLYNRGMCYGEPTQAEYEKTWLVCNAKFWLTF